MSPRPSRIAFVAFFLLALNVFFFWKVLFTNQAMFPWDAADQFYPAFAFVHEELRHFRLPLWDPYVLSGYPIIGDIQAQIFYPINWLMVVLHPFSPLPYRLVEVIEVLHFFLAGLFLYLLAREFVESEVAALTGAVLFMWSGAMVAHTQHIASIDAMTWVPLIFLLARRGLLYREVIYYTVGTGLLFGVQILAGHWQHSVYLGLLLFLYYLYEACFGPLRKHLWPYWLYGLALIAAMGAALAMVQILPCYELGAQSVRAFVNYWAITAGNEPRFLWTLVYPNYFGGINGVPQWYPADLSFNYAFLTIPGCLLALTGLYEMVRQRNFFWLGAVVLFTELSFGNQGHLAGLVYRTPVLNLFRTMATFFDLTNFILCLMAAVGAQKLIGERAFATAWKRFPIRAVVRLAVFVAALMLVAVVAGQGFQLSAKIHDWYHMALVFALFLGLAAASVTQRLDPRVAQWAVLALVIFELCFYNRNQKFNAGDEDPRRFLSHEYAVGRKESLQFLRSDPATDFRVAAMGEYQWSGNGWNVWRIAGITGINPLILSRYDAYARLFTHVSTFRMAEETTDHDWNSPLVDLLGVKYFVLANPAREQALGLPERFHQVFEDLGWWRIYRNDHYISRVWFYPQAYAVPEESHSFTLLSARWFDPRKILLLEKGALAPEAAGQVEELSVEPLFPGEGARISEGQFMSDPFCAEPLPMIGGWGGRAATLQFEVPASVAAGRYGLFLRYSSNHLATLPVSMQPLGREYPWYQSGQATMFRVQVTVESGNSRQSGEPVALPWTYGWPCDAARPADLGKIEIASEPTRITLTSLEESALNVYSLLLVRLPRELPEQASDFSFGDFSISPNRISFRAKLGRAGFVLLNDVYDPGWEASVDGTATRVYPADGLFRALFLREGSHEIEFRFRPRRFVWGAVISLLTACISLGYLAARRRSRRQRGDPASFTPPNPR